jgi:hypothetical protein
MNLSDYILLPREQRIAHIDFASGCILGRAKNTKGARNALIKYLGITEDVKQREIHCCHLCPNNSRAEQHCHNPLHMYLGTRTENAYDKPATTRSAAAKKARAAGLARSTPEERSDRARKGALAKLEKYSRDEIAAATSAGIQRMTPEQRSERSRKANSSRTPKQRSEIANKTNNAQTPEERQERQRRAMQTYLANSTHEERSERAKKAAETRRRNKQGG